MNYSPTSQHSNLQTIPMHQCYQSLCQFANKTNRLSTPIVLNAKPGHGKTQALHSFLKDVLHSHEKEAACSPLLIVLNEKYQQDLLANFLSDTSTKKFLVINSDNYQANKHRIEAANIVVITHSRLQTIFIELEEKGAFAKNANSFIYYKQNKTDLPTGRKIIIDEMPQLMNGKVFHLDELSWLVQLLNVYSDLVNEKKESSLSDDTFLEKIIIQSAIHRSLAIELLKKTNSECNHALHSHLTFEEKELVNHFFRLVDENKYECLAGKNDLISWFNWLYKLYQNDGVGFIDTDEYKRKKQLLCASYLPYHRYSHGLLIMDGTYEYSKVFYPDSFEEQVIPDQTNYTNVKIKLRNYATSAANRQRTPVYKHIGSDIIRLRKEFPDSELFPLINKNDIQKYFSLESVITEKQKKFYIETEHLPLNILNTRGKNVLRDYSQLYLTSIPNKAANYYKLLAICRYPTIPLSFELVNHTPKEKNHTTWFKDTRIQKIYEAEILSELTQIIHRTKLRELKRNTDTPIIIYIATTAQNFLFELFQKTPFCQAIQTDSRPATQATFESKVQIYCEEIVRYFETHPEASSCFAGKINPKLKTFLKNNYTSDSENNEKKIVIDTFFKDRNLEYKLLNSKNHSRKIFKLP